MPSRRLPDQLTHVTRGHVHNGAAPNANSVTTQLAAADMGLPVGDRFISEPKACAICPSQENAVSMA
jgi:hypothetical protein